MGELAHYAELEASIEGAITKTQEDIVHLKETLLNERLRRQHKEEYETVSRIINKHRPRKDLEADIAKLRGKMEELEGDHREVSNQIDMRRKQFHLLMHSIQELKSAMSNSSDGSTQSAPNSQLAKGFSGGGNMEIAEDEDEDEVEERQQRGARGSASDVRDADSMDIDGGVDAREDGELEEGELDV